VLVIDSSHSVPSLKSAVSIHSLLLRWEELGVLVYANRSIESQVGTLLIAVIPGV
jgi:hypothetical protein